MANNQLLKKIFIQGEFKLLSGTRIGGSSSAMSIGGIDNIIIRNPMDNKPYLPGSSIKGKMRSLIEQRDGTIGEYSSKIVKFGVSLDSDSLASKLFGFSATTNQETNQHPSRLIVRDAHLSDYINEDFFKNTDLPFAEIKAEVTIDRVTAKANPRFIERVPAGATFKAEFVLNIFSSENETDLIKTVFEALTLLEDDYIGGGGSRGNGQIEFKLNDFYEKDKEQYKFDSNTNDKIDLKNKYAKYIAKFLK